MCRDKGGLGTVKKSVISKTVINKTVISKDSLYLSCKEKPFDMHRIGSVYVK